MTRPCVCGCPADLHEHYRPGRDCGACGPSVCPHYDTDRAGGYLDLSLAVAVAALCLLLLAGAAAALATAAGRQ